MRKNRFLNHGDTEGTESEPPSHLLFSVPSVPLWFLYSSALP